MGDRSTQIVNLISTEMNWDIVEWSSAKGLGVGVCYT